METQTAQTGKAQYTIIIPTRFNNGQRVPSELLTSLQSQILDTFGGYTRTNTVGAWRDDQGNVVRDPSHTIYTIADDTESNDLHWHAIARTVARMLHQSEVLISKSPVTAWFVLGEES